MPEAISPAAGIAAGRAPEPAPDTGFQPRWFRSQNDLLLYGRDYGDGATGLPLLCLGGLTRNSKDFHDLALRHSPFRRVVAPDYRGRGLSTRDPDWRNYRPETYVGDVLDFLTVLGVERAIVVGTSMGGLLAMGLAALRPALVAGVIINDIGPEIAGDGYRRILEYISTDRPQSDWPAAIVALRDMFPTLALPTPAKWQRMAEATYRRGDDGLLHYDWDPALVRGLASDSSNLPDLWAYYRGLGSRPALVLRGALSDVLSKATFERMAHEKPDLVRVEVPGAGHVPSLDEPESEKAIDEFLARF
jgi:pimeloyl-ACP methyl ester carboxylesterase